MSNLLFSLVVKRKRDLLRLRQFTSSAAALLGYSATDQKILAAATFDLACQVHLPGGRATVSMEISDECLHVVGKPLWKKRHADVPPGPAELRLSKCLPTAAPVARADVPWMLKQLQDLTPLNVFEEIKKINQELLGALLDSARLQEAVHERKELTAA